MDPVLISVISFVGSGLLGGNIYFVKRLVDKIDATDESVKELSKNVARLEGIIEGDRNGKRKH